MSAQDSHADGLSLTDTAKQQQRYQKELEEIAESIKEGKDEEVVIQHLNCLPSGPGCRIEEWKQTSSSLNLFQLAVLHRCRNIVEYLWVQHRNFMQKDLYWTTNHTHKDCVANSQEQISNSDQSTAFPPRGPKQQPSVQQTANASQLPAHQETTEELPAHQETTQQLPAHQETTQQLPAHQETTQQLPAHQETTQQLPAHQESTQQLPAQQETTQQLPAHQETTQQLPAHQETTQQLPAHQETTQQLPAHQETTQQLPAHQEATQQLPSHQEQTQPALVNHPLHLACWLGYVEIVRCLTRPAMAPAERKKFSHHQEQPSSTTGNQVREELQDLMKTVSVITIDTDTLVTAKSDSKEHPQGLPLELAVSSRSTGCVKYLLASVLLQWVSTQYYFLCMELKRKAVSLHLACCFSAPKVVALLLPTVSREVLHCRDAQGQTPLHFAVWSGDTETIRLLLENGADVNAYTYSSSSCLHILYRSKLQPFNYEANTRLLLEHGADLTAFENSSTGSGLMPLQVVVDELMDTSHHSLMMWKRGAAESLSVYTQSKRPAQQPLSVSCYLDGLVSCLRLLLEAGANPDLPDAHPLSGKNTLELILSSTRYNLVDKNPEILFSIVSLLLKFGATTKQDINASCCFPSSSTAHRHTKSQASHLNHFLCNHLPRISDGTLQAQFIFLLCQNGMEADAICHGLVAHLHCSQPHVSPFEWHPTCLLMLVNWMSVEALRLLPTVFPYLSSSEHNKGTHDLALCALFGSPVRSLKHTCKVAVLKQLRHRSCGVKSLPLPAVVKSYLLGDYF